MLSSSGSSLRVRSPMRRALRAIDPVLASMLFAEVVIDTTTRELGERLFTYHVPEHLRDEVFVGSQVLIPFGHQELIAGYVVALHNDIADTQYGAQKLLETNGERNALSTVPKTRAIAEVIESEPLFDKSYISLLHFVADYYAAGISEVIGAALPADIGARHKRVARLAGPDDPLPPNLQAKEGSLFGSAPVNFGANEQGLLRQLEAAKGKSIALKTLRQRSGLSQTKFYTSLSMLRQSGLVLVENEADSKAGPKTISCVMVTGEPAKTKKQEELLATVNRAGGQMSVADLVKAAGTTHATIKKMCNDGVFQQIQEEIIRDPLMALAGRTKKETPPPLTGHQEAAFNTLHAALRDLLNQHPIDGETTELGRSDDVEHDRQAAAGASDSNYHGMSTGEENHQSAPWLLHGVTGSGKTEIYLRLIEETLRKGRSALMLVPEISLTPQLAQRLVSRFGELVAVWHSGLSAGERFDTWRRMRAGQARVLLGARSAVLAALPNVGIIILDEEHDGSYKQSTPAPRYHARTVAFERAKRENALLLLGSATPDLGTYATARETNRLVALPERVFKQALPKSTLVDMRSEYAVGNKSIFSGPLQNAIAGRLARKEQIILLMNRRGYASHVLCKACGFVVRCKNCSVSLVYHQNAAHLPQPVSLPPTAMAPVQSLKPAQNARPVYSPQHTVTTPYSQTARPSQSGQADTQFGSNPYKTATAQSTDGVLVCHHCAFTAESWQTCPACKSPFIKQFGLGTQRVEEEVRALFPTARVLRLDSDVTTKRGAYEEIFEAFKSGGADILIGTQIVAKGLDIAKVTLVGVLAADAAFNLPDYRTAERGFQLLTQVSGRAGRGEHPGEVVLQSYNLDMPALTLARKQDYETFAEQELASRKDFEYPPFSQIIRVVISGEALDHVEAVSEQLAEELSNYLEPDFTEEQIKILGPAPCIIDRLRGKYRHHIIVKNLAGDFGRASITRFLRSRRPIGINLGIDVDALDLV